MRLHNTERDINIRRDQNTLIIVGIGTMVFAVWTVIKYAGIMLMRRGIILEEFRKSPEFVEGFENLEISDTLIFNIMFIMVMTVLVLDLIFRIYVGASAVAEGRGIRKRKNGFYIFIAVIMIIFGIVTIITTIVSTIKSKGTEEFRMFGDESPITAAIIEATSAIMLMQMVYSAHRIRKYKRLGKHAKGK